MAEYTTHSGTTFEAPELLPCPCCGGKAELMFKGNDYTKKRSVNIKCKSCKLQRTDAAKRNTAQWCAEVAIKQWNERRQYVLLKNAALPIFDVMQSAFFAAREKVPHPDWDYIYDDFEDWYKEHFA